MIELIKRLFATRKAITIESLELNSWLPIKYAESSWDEIIIRNEKGWLRICTCLAKRDNSLAFYDHNDMEIKGFKPTEFLKISNPLNDRDYVIALAKKFNITESELK